MTINYSPEVAELQQRLNDAGYNLEVDGVHRKATKAALDDYLQRCLEQPLPPKPPWASKRMIGLVVTLVGVVAGFLGYEFDAAQLEELLVALATVAGLVLAFVGSVKAKQPIALRRKDPAPVAVGRRRSGDGGMQPPARLPSDADESRHHSMDAGDYLGAFGRDD